MFAPWEGAFVPLGDAGARVGTFARECGPGDRHAPSQRGEKDPPDARWRMHGSFSSVSDGFDPSGGAAASRGSFSGPATGISQAPIPRQGSSLGT